MASRFPQASPELRVRDAEPADLAAVQAIYAYHVETGIASFEETPPDRAEMERRWRTVREAGLPFLVAECKGEVIGFACCGPYRPRPGYRFTVEDTIYVAPDRTHRGIGRALLEALIDRCASASVRQMIAVIGDSDNLASIRLHERLGFRVVGVLRNVGFKHGRWVDSVLMQRSIGAGADTLPSD